MNSAKEPARILVNCAGIAPRLPLSDRKMTHCLDAFDFVWKANVTGTFLPITRFALHASGTQPVGDDNGVIINVSSSAAFDRQAGQSAYAASKGAITTMTLPLARELAQNRIRVVCIAPGLFDTPMLKVASRINPQELACQVPHPRRLGDPSEFAKLVCHVAGNSMINGEVIRLDGAMRLGPVQQETVRSRVSALR